MKPLRAGLFTLLLTGCLSGPAPDQGEVMSSQSELTSAQRRTRAAQIRDAAFANGITEGYLLAGIADSETGMSHCQSELTWACRGPASADCGGGPVVAGAGDGPCADMQGGLGMFQFDAGTYAQTLAREGDRILSIAGNVAAAVDFVVNMVIRSTHISSVDNRAQAIDWINGVRIGNGRWDAWIRTVTHYYNGCAPSYSCFPERYGRYAGHTEDVFDEMGADFWLTSVDLAAEFVAQSFPLAAEAFELYPGEVVPGVIEMRNVGEATWAPGTTNLGTTEPRDGASPLAADDWLGENRATTVDRVVAPGEVGRFEFSIRAPAELGEHSQFFNLVQEGVAWFHDQGGPPADQLQIRVTVIAPPPCPSGLGEEWTCEGLDRARCVFGEVERMTCASGCTGGLCDEDLDGDGETAPLDCDETDPAVHSGATERCGDGIDQDCDGVDLACDPGIPTDRSGEPMMIVSSPEDGAGLTGSCSASAGRRTSGLGALLFVALSLVSLSRRGRSSRRRSRRQG